VAGRQIRKLVAGEQTAGIHAATWDGKNDQGVQVQRGVYFARTVIAGRKEATSRILYLTSGQ
jgi:flagellar hook assembly protein FlgD